MTASDPKPFRGEPLIDLVRKALDGRIAPARSGRHEAEQE